MKKERKPGISESPVTETDFSINDLIIKKITSTFPDHSIMGEERPGIVASSKYIWVCDPLDWTIAFSHGIPICTFSLSLVEDGQPIIAVVYDPFTDRLFSASKWDWAYLNWSRIHVGDFKNLTNTAIWMEWWKWMKRIRNYSAISEYLTEEFNCRIMKYNSFIFMGMLVACWEFSAVLFPWGCPWDMVTIKLIVEEAGWRTTNLEWGNDRYDVANCKWMIASNGLLHDELLHIVKQNLNTQKQESL